jgi:two-component system sensor histidine kinase VicK
METRKYPLRAIKDIGRLSPDGLLLYNLSEARVEYCNKSLSRILGVSKDDLMDIATLRRTILDDDKLIEDQLRDLKANSQVSNVELRVKSKDNKYISCDAYFINKGNVIVAIVKDITKSKQHLNYTVDFGARKDVILDMVAHNMSGPLNMTNNLLDVVDRMKKTREFKSIDNPTRLIRENTQQCIEIINSFLKQEHLTSETIYVESNRFDIIEKLQSVVDKFKEFVKDKHIKVITKAKNVFITGDDVKLFQVIHNLVSNAVKFTDANGKISIEVIELNDTVQIKVQDNGIGIPEYLHPHLFKKNTPAGRTGLRGEKSIGMGLYIVKKLVELMKGDVSFETEEDHGTIFTVELPRN